MGLQIGKIFGLQTTPVKAVETRPFTKNECLPKYGMNGQANPSQPETFNLNPYAGPVCGKSLYCVA